MKEIFWSLAMVIGFWLPAIVAVSAMAAAIPMKNLQLAVIGASGLLCAILLRLLIVRMSAK